MMVVLWWWSGGRCERSGLPSDGLLLNQAPLFIAESRSFTRPCAFLFLCLHLMSLSVQMLTQHRVSMAQPCGHCTCCTIQDLHIWKLTTTRFHETRPRVCFLLSTSICLLLPGILGGARPHARQARLVLVFRFVIFGLGMKLGGLVCCINCHTPTT
uniref:Uncharacterized protein n=1 Tax=Helianthus annuus TaxID=4232 RepID=A0A251VFY4_HELAN